MILMHRHVPRHIFMAEINQRRGALVATPRAEPVVDHQEGVAVTKLLAECGVSSASLHLLAFCCSSMVCAAVQYVHRVGCVCCIS